MLDTLADADRKGLDGDPIDALIHYTALVFDLLIDRDHAIDRKGFNNLAEYILLPDTIPGSRQPEFSPHLINLSNDIIRHAQLLSPFAFRFRRPLFCRVETDL